MTLTLQDNGGDEALDLGSLDGGLLSLLLSGDDTLDDVFADIVFLGQVEELADLGGALRTETTGDGGVGQTGKGLFALLADDDGEDREIGTDDATTN